MNIREHWPNITNEEVEVLRKYDCYEWMILRHLYNASIIGGKEISQDDLKRAGFPKNKGMEAKRAIESLEKKKILIKKPKPGLTIYQTKPEFFANEKTVVSFINLVTAHESLRKAMVGGTLEFTKISETLIVSLNKVLNSNRDRIIEEKVTASDKKTIFDDDQGLVVHLKLNCQKGGHFEIDFDIVDPQELSTLLLSAHCTCGSVHDCTASGRVISTYFR